VTGVPSLFDPQAAADSTPAVDVAGPNRGEAAGPATPLVIGLDLSLTGTGIASSAGWVGTITSKGKADATLDHRHSRLHNLRLDIALHIPSGHTRPALIVVEAPAYDSRTGHQHDRSGLWWLVVDWLSNSELADGWGYRVVEITTGGVKKYATGKGNASKDQVLAAVVRRYPTIEVRNNNEADALVLAAMGARALGHPIDDLPKLNLEAMAAVAWPEPVVV
jgi:crossover junction endodeoxyribonuclease RuvC